MVVVEHDEDIMTAADHLVDMGPWQERSVVKLCFLAITKNSGIAGRT